jgi:hypothetical protein
MILTKVAERKTIQVPAVAGIAKRAEIGVVRRYDDGASAGCKQPVKFFDGAYHVRDMLDHVDGADFAERAVTERKGEMIQAGDYVSPGMGITVEADCAWMLVEAAPYVKNWKLAYRTRRFG